MTNSALGVENRVGASQITRDTHTDCVTGLLQAPQLREATDVVSFSVP